MIILASQSPRRLELINLLDLEFVVKPAEVDESLRPGESAEAYVLRLAETKARTVAAQAQPEDLLIGSDTAVVDGNEILGKPVSQEEAVWMLRKLRGRSHQVFSAVAVMRASDEKLFTEVCKTDVPMRNFSEDEIYAYVDSGDPMDKAGAYAIQNAEFQPVSFLSGCFANVMGLPLCHLTRTLRRFDTAPRTDVPTACQKALNYDCPVYEDILTVDRMNTLLD
jgi:septum formation protein